MSTAALKEAATNPDNVTSLAEMKPKDRIAHLLNSKRDDIQKMLPRHLSADRLLKVAQVAIMTTPKLLKCDVTSLAAAIAQCAQMGLEPNTVLGHAYFVPFNTKRKDEKGIDKWVDSVQVIIGYKGLIDLARRSGQIVSIAAHEVCKGDLFEYEYGLQDKLRHIPADGERGAITHFYAVAHLKDGGHCFEVMTLRQVEAIRDGSKGWQDAVKYKKTDSAPWGKHFIEMGRKTAIRRLAKYLPLSVEFSRAVAIDELAEAGKDQRLESLDAEFSVMPENPYADDEPAALPESSAIPVEVPAEREPAPIRAPRERASERRVVAPKLSHNAEVLVKQANEATSAEAVDKARALLGTYGPTFEPDELTYVAGVIQSAERRLSL